MSASEIGIIGMGVMGRSLAKNAAGKGICLSVYNRMTEAEKEVIPTLLQAYFQNEHTRGFMK